MKKIILAILLGIWIINYAYALDTPTNSQSNVRVMILLENRGSNCLVASYTGQKIIIILRDAPKTLYRDIPDFSGQDRLIKMEEMRLGRIKDQLSLWSSKLPSSIISVDANTPIAVSIRQYNYALEQYETAVDKLNGWKKQIQEAKQDSKESDPYHHRIRIKVFSTGKIIDNVVEWKFIP